MKKFNNGDKVMINGSEEEIIKANNANRLGNMLCDESMFTEVKPGMTGVVVNPNYDLNVCKIDFDNGKRSVIEMSMLKLIEDKKSNKINNMNKEINADDYDMVVVMKCKNKVADVEIYCDGEVEEFSIDNQLSEEVGAIRALLKLLR